MTNFNCQIFEKNNKFLNRQCFPSDPDKEKGFTRGEVDGSGLTEDCFSIDVMQECWNQ